MSDCPIRQLQAGDVLLAPGTPNRNLYLLLRGRLKVHVGRLDADAVAIEPGECVGEISLIDGEPPTGYVIADEPGEVLVVTETQLWEQLLRVPEIAKNFTRLFAARFRARSAAMQRALEQQLRYQHLQRELAIARDIQTGMLPRDVRLGPEIEIAAQMTPAHEIGGDFYDIFPIGREEYCLAIGDVSGKGIPAALFMVKTMTVLRTELLKEQPIEEALRRLNMLLCEDNARCMFATLIVATVNKVTGVVRYANAGHDPIVFGEGGRCVPPASPPQRNSRRRRRRRDLRTRIADTEKRRCIVALHRRRNRGHECRPRTVHVGTADDMPAAEAGRLRPGARQPHQGRCRGLHRGRTAI